MAVDPAYIVALISAGPPTIAALVALKKISVVKGQTSTPNGQTLGVMLYEHITDEDMHNHPEE